MLTRIAFTIVLLTLCGSALRAHEPGLSSIELRLDEKGMTVRADVSSRDWKLIEHAPQLFRMTIDGQPVMLGEKAVAKQRNGDSEDVRVTYRFSWEGDWTRLEVQAGFLDLLPLGHRAFLTARVGGARPFAEQLLDARHPAYTIDLSSASQGQ